MKNDSKLKTGWDLYFAGLLTAATGCVAIEGAKAEDYSLAFLAALVMAGGIWMGHSFHKDLRKEVTEDKQAIENAQQQCQDLKKECQRLQAEKLHQKS